MPLNFYKSTEDTGSALESAIQPIANGEALSADVLNRPLENLRNRTEVVRQAFDLQELLDRSDRGLTILSAPTTTVTVSVASSKYSFSVNSDLVIGPIVSPAILSGSSAPIVAKLVRVDPSVSPTGGAFSLTARRPDGLGGYVARKVAEGAHNIFYRIYTEPSVNTLAVTVEGALDPNSPDPEVGPVTIAIRAAANGSTTVGALVSALNGHTGIQKLVLATALSSQTESYIATPVAPIRLYEGEDTYAGQRCVGGVDDELIRIQSSTLSTFFGTDANKLLEGSFLVADVATPKARLTSSYPSSVTLRTIHPDATSDSRNLAKNPGTIPICKVLGGKVYFLNGRCFEAGTTDYLVGSKKADGTLRAELASQTAPAGETLVGAAEKGTGGHLVLPQGWVSTQLSTLATLGSESSGAGAALVGSAEISGSNLDVPFTLAAGTIRSQLQSLLNQLVDQDTSGGNTDGAGRIGAAEITYGTPTVTIPEGTASSQIVDLASKIVSHFQGSAYKHSLNDITGAPFKVVASDETGDYSKIGDAIAALVTTGGTILVSPGTYSEYKDFSAATTFAAPIYVIGCGEVIWQCTSSNYNLRLGDSVILNAPLVFENIKFVNTANMPMVMVTADTAGVQGSVEFYKCRFAHSGSSGRMMTLESACRAVIERCFFESTATFTGACYTIGLNNASLELWCNANTFYHCCGLITGIAKLLIASRNDIIECGWGSGTSFAYLFNPTVVDNLILDSNNCRDFTHTGTRYALFLKVSTEVTCAVVSRNVMYPRVAISGTFQTDGSNHLFNFPSATGVIVLQSNSFPNCGNVGGIYFGAAAQSFIHGNVFSDAALSGLAGTELFYFIDCAPGYATLSNNRIHSTNSAAYFPTAVRLGTYSTLTENALLNFVVGVRLSGNYLSIHSNLISTKDDTDSCALRVIGNCSYASISGNTIQARKGLETISSYSISYSTFDSNRVAIYDAADQVSAFLAKAIDFVMGTSVFTYGGSGAVAGISILAGSSHVVCRGSRLAGFESAIVTSGPYTSIQNCNIKYGGVAGVTINTPADYSQVIGNSFYSTVTNHSSATSYGVECMASCAVISNNSMDQAEFGVVVVEGSFVVVDGNRINLQDKANVIGVKFAGSSDLQDLMGSALNNLITKAGYSNVSGTYGIYLMGSKIACAGNLIRNYHDGHPDFSAAIAQGTNSGGNGLGYGLSASNFEVHNLYYNS